MENFVKPETSDHKEFPEKVLAMEICVKPETSDPQVFPEKVPPVEICVKPKTSYPQVFPEKVLPELERLNLENPSKKALSMEAGSCYKPKQGAGDDAHFICPWNQTIGVADGVGGWVEKGIDAGEYARGIMGSIIMGFVANPLSNTPVDFPYLSRILAEAFINTRVQGSSTVCLVTLSGHELVCLNVGDSGFRVIRKGKTVFASRPQVKSFNHPYQLGTSRGCDDPGSALEIRFGVEIGDVVVVGTDGLFDNVFMWELEDLVNNGKWCNDTPKGVAANIVEYARVKSIDKTCRSPFANECERVGIKHNGGKKDDITVMVVYIV